MPLTISDEELEQLHMSDREARLEFACRLFQAGRVSLPAASKLARVSRTGIEDALFQRGIPVYVYTEEHLKQDLETIEYFRKQREAGGGK